MNKRIQLHNVDAIDFIQTLPAGSIDVICIDPPYLYLKNQKLERPFDERLLFSECKRVLTDKGFVVMFGRGVSFYRWNCLLDELGMTFKEEVIWNKRRTTSPALKLGRVHETISIFSKGPSSINKSIVNYGEAKAFDLDKVYEDIKRLGGLFNKGAAYDKVVKNLKKVCQGESYRDGNNSRGHRHTYSSDMQNKCISTYTILALENGVREQSIISDNSTHYSTIHPTQKPVRLLERLLALVIPDKPRNEIVVADFFAGSMSCMEAVHNMGMNGIACEIDEEYFEAGKKRIDELLSKPIQSTFL